MKNQYEHIDLCSCYEPIFEPPTELLESFQSIVERKIGNTWYLIETVCDGSERLSEKVKRLIFSDKEVICP